MEAPGSGTIQLGEHAGEPPVPGLPLLPLAGELGAGERLEPR